jgi:hypothetical protein
MIRRLLAALAALAILVIPSSIPTTAAASSCQFVLGFKAIHDAMPNVVGDCLVDEHHNPANGDGLQETSGVGGKGGLLVWRKADNWTAYTDGYRTWINGPNGLQQRLNTERFSWENDGSAPPAPTATCTPSPAPSQSTTQPPATTCCKVCTTGKACGNSCISRAYTCHQPPGCACDAR